MPMDVRQAQEQLRTLLAQIRRDDVPSFLQWAKGFVADELEDVQHSNTDVLLKQIQEDLRQTIPMTAVMPSEEIVFPSTGENAKCDPATTVHVDGFLFDDEVVDELVEQGRMSRNYCTECGSHKVAPLTFLSHSMTLSQVKYIFHYLVPDLTGKTVLDVGSRLGAVLYGAYYYSSAGPVVGVEMNRDLCELQHRVVEKYQLNNRVQIICDDICNQLDLLQSADVLVMNNVFEFFASPEKQQRIWELICSNAKKPGTYLVMSPSLEESLEHLQTNTDLGKWVRKVDTMERLAVANQTLFGSKTSEDSDLADIHLYQVL